MIKIQKRLLLQVVVSFIIFYVYIGSNNNVKETQKNEPCTPVTSPIDIVYTWVNGSDPAFLRQLTHQDKTRSDTAEDTAQSRFQDFNQLLYSLRSIEMYAPWANRVFIVTNGQVPFWLNETHATIVTHDTIFDDPTHLPTFNAQAIEANLHRIPGLAENFIYFNDDTALATPTCPRDFVSDESGFVVRSGGAEYGFMKRHFFAPAKCSESCLAKRDNDVCDDQCNTVNCLYDGNECAKQLPPGDGRPSWFGAVHFTFAMLIEKAGFELVARSAVKVTHTPLLMNTRILADLRSHFGAYYTETSSHHTRQRNEVQTQIMYVNWLVVAPSVVNVDKQLYRFRVADTADTLFIGYGKGTVDEAQQLLLKTLDKISQIKLLCVNDLIDYSVEYEAEKKMFLVQNFYEKLYSKQSKYERVLTS